MTRATRSEVPFNLAFLAVLVSFALSASGCGSADGGSADEGAADGVADGFCTRLEAASGEDTPLVEDDPAETAAAAEELRDLASRAPEEVAGAITTFADLLDQMAELDQAGEGDTESFGEAMALMFDPEIIEAGKVLEEYAVSECGFDPGDASARFGSSTEDSGGPEGPGGLELDPTTPDAGGATDDVRSAGEISLEDLDEVKADHSDESWSAKIVSSTISGDSSIELYGKGPKDELIELEPLTAHEAVDACEALRDAFSEKQPELEVQVGNAGTVLAEGTASEACAPV